MGNGGQRLEIPGMRFSFHLIRAISLDVDAIYIVSTLNSIHDLVKVRRYYLGYKILLRDVSLIGAVHTT